MLNKIISFLFAVFVFGNPAFAADEVYNRVIESGKIRCGYVVIGKAIIKDPNSGKISGIAYDLLEEIGINLNLEIVWQEETTFANSIAGIKSGRYDLICTSLYAKPQVMKDLEMTKPYYYIPVNVYGKLDEKRFKTKEELNNPEIKISVMDGTIPALIREQDYPNSSLLSLPDSDYSDILLGVSTGKADVTFVEPSVAEDFLKSNPNTLKKLEAVSPLRMFPVVFGMNKGEHNLNTMLSWTIQYLQDQGKIDQIIKKYEDKPGMFIRVATPYQQSKE